MSSPLYIATTAVSWPASGCWHIVAKGGRARLKKPNDNGYVFARAKVRGHRHFYEKLVGPIAPGLEPDHLCRNRACCHPGHVEPVTRKENLARGEQAQSRKTHCKHGHEFTPENTLLWKNWLGGPHRVCRTCNRARWLKSDQRTRRMATAKKRRPT